MTLKKFASSATSAKAMKIAAALVVAGVLAACQDSGGLRSARAYQPIPAETLALIQTKGSSKNAPILIRTYKKESELEIWKQTADGSYVHLKTYPMCRWSGQLGPKRREGDRQVPEGFYSITPAQMNPNSNYYLSFNVGYPNAYDRAHGYTGSMIMVHGDCSSAGCFSMTDEQIAEIYAIAREAFSGGQQAIQMQSMPFRMTPENLAKHRIDPNMPFWKEIKEGYDQFEVSKREPRVAVCNGRYAFGSASMNGAGCAPVQDADVSALVAERRRDQEAKVADLVASGVKPVKVVYSDGGQNPQFAHVSMVSRPEALAAGPVEIALDEKGKPAPAPRTAVAKVTPEATQPAAAPQPATTAVARSTVQPVPAVPAATAFAPATPVAAPATASTDKPFYQRWMGIGDILKADEQAASPATSADTTASTTPSTTPAVTPVVARPSVRPAARSSSRQQPAQQPEQNSKIVDPRQKTSALPQVIAGAQQPLPAGTLAR
ncbi:MULTISPECIES: murein L,D-transpeptidase family protein [unclassified Beijerinckia]|uniref:L,D-transpeptidase family protein n=1 Tax=unclassified Beijerinckia TaxID=2638183 RepID=UPI00089597C0|nr:MULTISPECIES: murein L,D-transpeptidase family protein [unclassified Beijerinckia]MDH7798128.1 murein L,D-transpeptidase YafK [Beijerinckia sp. GAS462]SED10041.1 Murein L,D-transpeptidase YafK [Beijerinckia sp. 28-YEA-48]